MESEKEYRYRISILKFNGSVWMEECEDLPTILEQIEALLDKHPHLLISRQRVVDKNDR
tara:strand:+ start:1178 stop:1354 length:177 start_codon:yes stop_codon:yes gene_type:complete